MICFNTQSIGEKVRGEGGSSRNKDPEDSNQEHKERPVVIYSRKFSESCYSDEKIFYNNKRATLYKTEMCRSYSETGTCRYGESCQFCHSESELRSVERHPKYKTEICRTFWLEGSCPYGKRCCFAHLDNAELIEKAKKLGVFKKQRKPKEAENAQLSAFSLSIDDSVPALCEETEADSQAELWDEKEKGNFPEIALFCLPLVDIREQAGPKEQNPEITNMPDIFSNNTEFESTVQNRSEAFTFSKYYGKNFEPMAAHEFEETNDRQNTWSLNELNKWKDEPLNFVPKNKNRHQ